MPVVNIRKVLMLVSYRLMVVPVSMYRSRCHGLIMQMSMMFIVRMLVFMFDHFVRMNVTVSFGQMQPNTRSH